MALGAGPSSVTPDDHPSVNGVSDVSETPAEKRFGNFWARDSEGLLVQFDIVAEGQRGHYDSFRQGVANSVQKCLVVAK
jgi:hypothetical protein